MNVRLTRSANCLSLAVMLCLLAPALGVAQPFHFESGRFSTEALSSNLFGDSSVRPYRIYLPPSYDTTTKRYPVIYVLHGFTQNEQSLGNVGATLDSMIRKRTAREMIVVFVNAENSLNGSFYLNSQVIGDYETYITRDLINLIDARYRTLSARESRGISGSTIPPPSGQTEPRASWCGLVRQTSINLPASIGRPPVFKRCSRAFCRMQSGRHFSRIILIKL
jgi:hypothetical protein